MKITVALVAAGALGALLLGVDYKVEVAGAMRQIMQQSDLSAKADLDTLVTRPHLYALGPAEGLNIHCSTSQRSRKP